MQGAETPGASQQAIQAHYDIGDDFFRLWLDPTMTYSCALWEPGDDLERAQLRKLDFHAHHAEAQGREAVLDVGCGWGSMLERLCVIHRARSVVGLTLSDAQRAAIVSRDLSGVDARVEHWSEHSPRGHYDSIVCIGALEHFVSPETRDDRRLATYREFFSACHQWLRPGRCISLQTIAYGVGRFRHGAIASIFPESDLPRLPEIAAALDGLFEIVSVRNDRADYARTCRCWLENLRANEGKAKNVVTPATARHYMRFLAAAARGFDENVFHLLRMKLRRMESRG